MTTEEITIAVLENGIILAPLKDRDAPAQLAGILGASHYQVLRASRIEWAPGAQGFMVEAPNHRRWLGRTKRRTIRVADHDHPLPYAVFKSRAAALKAEREHFWELVLHE